jgi:hypothetical protein
VSRSPFSVLDFALILILQEEGCGVRYPLSDTLAYTTTLIFIDFLVGKELSLVILNSLWSPERQRRHLGDVSVKYTTGTYTVNAGAPCKSMLS